MHLFFEVDLLDNGSVWKDNVLPLKRTSFCEFIGQSLINTNEMKEESGIKESRTHKNDEEKRGKALERDIGMKV